MVGSGIVILRGAITQDLHKYIKVYRRSVPHKKRSHQRDLRLIFPVLPRESGDTEGDTAPHGAGR